jgi:hypothetical protein
LDHAPILKRQQRQTGIALLAIVAILAVVAIAIFAKWAMSDAQRRLRKTTDIAKILDRVDRAMVDYVTQHRRLPCPADGRVVSGSPNVGLELAACASQMHGVLPWVTLGLSEDEARDPWNGRLTYRVDPALTSLVPRLMDMSNCDVAGTGSVGAGGVCRIPTPPCVANPATCTSPTTFLAGKGLDVWNGVGGAAGWATRINNRPLGTGAAYVVISHGESGAGAYNARGVFQPGTIGAISLFPSPGTQFAGDNEMSNLANLALTLPATQATTYRDAAFDPAISRTHFDDYLRHPSITEVLKNARLRDRTH